MCGGYLQPFAQRTHQLQCLEDSYFVLLHFAATTFDSNTTWLNELVSVPYMVYHAGDTSKSHNHPSHANEAMGYLWFLAEYYDCLPNVSLSLA